MNETRQSEFTPPKLSLSISRLRRVFRLARKELREILRDRRTIITLIAMPLLLYPLMTVAFQQFYLASRVSPHTATEYKIATPGGTGMSAFDRRFDQGQAAWRRANGLPKSRKLPRLQWLQPPSPRTRLDLLKVQPGAKITFTDEDRADVLEQLKENLLAGDIDLLVDMPKLEPEDLTRDEFVPCKVYFLKKSGVARAALVHIEEMFAAVNEENLKKRLNTAPGSPPVTLLTMRPEGLGTDDGLVTLATLVPLILILMTITGAVYPAIDLTAGERERGTLEILVAAPVSRFDLLTAKYISVVTVAVMNAVANLVCMSITMSWSGLGSVLIRDGGLSAGLLLQVLALLLLFAAFFSAVLLCLTSFARSFKEAQAYLIPLMLASITPGVLAMIPGLKLEGVLSVLPLVNIVLLARDLFDGSRETGINPYIATIVVATTLLYAMTALSLAASVFGAEGVLYSEQSSWSDLLRRPDEPQPVATVPAMMWCLALMVPVQFGLVAIVRDQKFSLVINILLGIAINGLLFALVPAVFVYLGRVQLRSGLGMTMPRPAALLAAVLLGVSLWPMALYLLMLAHGGMSDELTERFSAVLEQFKEARESSLGWGFSVIVIVPAVLEEFFFRGLLFQALKTRANAWVTIGVSGLLFGVAHIVLDGASGLERLAPSLLLGLILSTVCWRSGSLWPSVILHVCHNVILTTVDLSETKAIPWQWLAAGAAGTTAAFLLLLWWGKPNAKPRGEVLRTSGMT